MIYKYTHPHGVVEKEIAALRVHEERLHLSLPNVMVDITNAIVAFEHKMQEHGNYFCRANRIAMNRKLLFLIQHSCSMSKFERPAFSNALCQDYDKHETTLFGLKIVVRDDFADDEIDIYKEEELC